MTMEKEEQLFRKRVLELAELCFHRDMPSNTDFLNLNEQTIFQSIFLCCLNGLLHNFNTDHMP